MPFVKIWNLLIFSPRRFFTDHFDKKNSPYLWCALMIFGASRAIERIDKKFIQYDLRGNSEAIETLNNWAFYWTVVILGGMIGGYFFYHVGGWFYNLRVKWAGGNPDAETSRFIYLYSNFIPALPNVVFTFGQTLSRPQPYDPSGDGTLYDTLLFFLFMGLLYYSVHVSYVGVTTRMAPSKTAGRIWFMILPCCVYTLAILGFIATIAFADSAD